VTRASGLFLTVAPELEDAARAEVLGLAEEAGRVDGTYPIDDQVRLDLDAEAGPTHRHVIARASGDAPIAGYAHVDLRSPDVAGAHIVVAPDRRRQGIGSALVTQAVDVATTSSPRTVRAWSHGDVPAAASLAQSLGWMRVRELLQMRLPRDHPIADPAYPPGVTVRTFSPGQDEPEWVEQNAAAFRGHPEQGRMTVDDLRQRERQSWFDPAGFFLAVRDGELVGSHWTKVHAEADDSPALGEVYVVGVRPDAQGGGLGKALTLTGLHYLRDRGLDVLLYVDGDNDAAVAVYTKIGFEVSKTDVMYERTHRAS
jgi:mycothiol synthase